MLTVSISSKMPGTTFSEAILLSRLVASCTSAYDNGLKAPVLSLIPMTSCPPRALLMATSSQPISYLSKIRSLNCALLTSPWSLSFKSSSAVIFLLLISSLFYCLNVIHHIYLNKPFHFVCHTLYYFISTSPPHHPTSHSSPPRHRQDQAE